MCGRRGISIQNGTAHADRVHGRNVLWRMKCGREMTRITFMTQKIVGRRDSKMRTLRMIGRSMLAGVAFSLAAVVVAVIAVPRVQARFGPVVPSGETTVTLGRDESTPSAEESGPSGESGENTGADSTGESGSEGTSPAETTAPEETVPVGEIVKAEIETWPFGMPEVLKLSYGLRGVADTADLSVVTIEQVREGQDWFDNELRTSGLYSGVVIAKTDSEILILASGNAVSGADRLVVDFGKGLKSDASVKRPDTASGLAVLTVPVTDENREKTEGVTPLELGNSYRLRRGDILIAVGAPLGMGRGASRHGPFRGLRRDRRSVPDQCDGRRGDPLPYGSRGQCLRGNLDAGH